MLTLRQVINYTLKTGRDIFDDFQELDRALAQQELGQKNQLGLISSQIMEGLDLIGIDPDGPLLDLMTPTLEPEEDEDGPDFVPDPVDELHARTRQRYPKKVVMTTIVNLTASEHIGDQVLLDAPYDMAIDVYNQVAKQQNKRR
nr:MAG TPA: hypothetical protein [Caudoviricetes sp.]